MKVELLCQPASSVAEIYLDRGETLTAEVGAMIGMSTKINVETSTRSQGGQGGILKGIKRMFSGENFFLNHFTSNADAQRLILGPKIIGDIIVRELQGESLIIQGSSWLASTGGIELDTSWQGWGSAAFSGEKVFWVKCSGTGTAIINSFGGIYEIDVDGEYVVDTGHIVAFDDTLQFSVGKASSTWLSSLMSGEGIVCRFKGMGKVYCQTHNLSDFGKSLGPKLKPRSA